MPTLQEIADLAGVNKTTVSKALRNSGDINRETARRIHEIASQLKYPVYKRQRQPSRIGILCPEVTSHYYSTMTTALYEAFIEANYRPFLMLTEFSRENEDKYLRMLMEDRLAGIVCITESPDIGLSVNGPVLEDTPIIVIGMNYQAANYDALSVDERVGIRAAVEHLVSLGHERIAFVGGLYGMQRMRFLEDALRLNKLTLPAEYVAVSELRDEINGYKQMKQLLGCDPLPTAVVAEYDLVALGAMRALFEAGLSVPGDISLVGFDNVEMGRYLPVSLTSIDCNVRDMCKIATSILLSKIHNAEYRTIQTVAVKPTLVVRESTGIAKR